MLLQFTWLEALCLGHPQKLQSATVVGPENGCISKVGSHVPWMSFDNANAVRVSFTRVRLYRKRPKLAESDGEKKKGRGAKQREKRRVGSPVW